MKHDNIDVLVGTLQVMVDRLNDNAWNKADFVSIARQALEIYESGNRWGDEDDNWTEALHQMGYLKHENTRHTQHYIDMWMEHRANKMELGNNELGDLVIYDGATGSKWKTEVEVTEGDCTVITQTHPTTGERQRVLLSCTVMPEIVMQTFTADMIHAIADKKEEIGTWWFHKQQKESV